jgi:hypothetical protein
MTETQAKPQSPKADDEESSETEEIPIAKKWKADTDCKNALFNEKLKERASVQPADF